MLLSFSFLCKGAVSFLAPPASWFSVWGFQPLLSRGEEASPCSLHLLQGCGGGKEAGRLERLQLKAPLTPHPLPLPPALPPRPPLQAAELSPLRPLCTWTSAGGPPGHSFPAPAQRSLEEKVRRLLMLLCCGCGWAAAESPCPSQCH